MSPGELQWWAVLPPLIAIGLALLLRRVVLSLVTGVVVGAFIAADFRPWDAVTRLVTVYFWPTLTQPGNLRILAFAFLLGGMIRLLSASGGSAHMARWVTRHASTRQRGQLTAWLLGILFFFDDYANTLFVGSSMRAVSDRLRISREKLAFIVDATAAPIASLAPLSSWIIVEVAYIADQFRALDISTDAYTAFLQTIPLRFYPVWMLVLGLWIALSGRDLGPMWRAERRRVLEGGMGEAEEEEAVPESMPGGEPAAAAGGVGDVMASAVSSVDLRKASRRALSLAFAPLLTSLVTIGGGLFYDGYRALAAARAEAVRALTEARRQLIMSEPGETRTQAAEAVQSARDQLATLEPSVGTLLSHATSSKVLLWGVIAGGLVALVLAVRQQHLGWGGALRAWAQGGREMSVVLVVLLSAWMLGAVCRDLHTAQYLVQLLGTGFPVGLLPSAVFLVGALISFGTGTSLGTMGILFPLAVPLSHALAPGDMELMLGAVASILAGSVFGDHCSPISDTTIMSAMASGCSQLDHVRTQLPYALLVGAVSVLFGTLPVGMGWYPVWLALPLGALVLWGVVRGWGRVATAASGH